ncbi:hypothetical protein [Streptomyces sp. NPDC051219]|uniref:hypothetical protein n=1 Tax=Streptomyces sp. NPDC051219 TaxID=3155283 RepID=UPI00343784FF
MTAFPSSSGMSPEERAAGIARVEGFLMAQAEWDRARAQAQAFAARMPWLTTAQYEEVVRLYTEERIALSRHILRAAATRAGELRAEYAARYRTVRQRLLCLTVASLAVSVALVMSALVTSVLLTAHR